MDYTVGRYEEANRKKSLLMSTMLTIALILLIFLPILSHLDPPPGQEGVLVNLGLPDMGQGDNNAGPSTPAEPEVSDEPEELEEPEEETTPPPPPAQPEKAKPEPVKEKEVIKTEDPRELAIKKEKERQKKLEEERIKNEKAELERQKKEAEAKRKAEEEAKRKKAEEEARKKAEADALKNKIGGLFGDGDGKGNTGKPGNQGDPDGDPNSKVLEGKSTGSGVVGGGLGSRGVDRRPSIVSNAQKEGRVVIEVCVDREGNVISANYTLRNSTTTDSQLKDLAIRNAKQWKFTKSNVDKQCGNITYDFKF